MKKILNGPTVWRAKCPVCDCEFEYDACEIRSEFLESPTDYEIIRVVECPSCKFKISHKENPKSPTDYEIIRVVECPSCKFKISHKENPKSPTEVKKEDTMST